MGLTTDLCGAADRGLSRGRKQSNEYCRPAVRYSIDLALIQYKAGMEYSLLGRGILIEHRQVWALKLDVEPKIGKFLIVTSLRIRGKCK